MNTDQSGLAARLAELAESAAPPSTVDVHTAARDGRARVRRRRFAVAATTLAVLVAGASTLAVLRPGAAADSVRPADGAPRSPSPTGTPSKYVGGPGSPAPAAPTSAQTALPFSGSDPLTAEAAFGWLPDFTKSVWYRAEWNGTSLQARGVVGGTPASPVMTLTVYPAGTTPELKDFPTGAHAVRVDAPAVNGREAYWVSSNDANYREGLDLLRWRTPDGRWAQLDSSGLPAADREQVPLRVAAGVTFAHRQVPLPFRLHGVPDTFKVSGVIVQQPVADAPQPWEVDVNYAAGDYNFTTVFVPAGSTATVPAAVIPSRAPLPGLPPVSQEPMACGNAQGVRACVSAQPVGMLGPVGGLTGWLGRFTLLGPDQSAWTTGVLG
ncbi:hypothetical protein GCM10009760_64230 [Kitasatospora kazusensis]|uniref:Uncharacterized protein n=1 Tax=Kitasatospora kazusensis TaxID=407974 RepID=A0ABP4KD90_9ACTN